MISVENHLGKITVSEKYLTELVRHTVTGCFGVAGVTDECTLRSAIASLLGGRFLDKKKGVYLRSANDSDLIIDLHIKVTYGTNITAAVNSITHKVSFAVEETVGIPVAKVNVFVDEMIY